MNVRLFIIIVYFCLLLYTVYIIIYDTNLRLVKTTPKLLWALAADVMYLNTDSELIRFDLAS